jgi:predicted dehydrogenase
MAASKKLGYAVVGLGDFAESAVLPAFRHSRKATVVALVSGDERKARRLAVKYGASDYYSYDDYALCLTNPRVEAVFITTHNAGHCPYTLRAAAAGKHVLCEKPMANTVEECQQMVDACRAYRLQLMIGYRKYFEPACRELKQLMANGKLGQVRLIHSAFTLILPPGGKRVSWQYDRQLAGGGALVDIGVYCVSTVRWLTGKEPTEAAAYQWNVHPERFTQVEENIAFRLNFPDGLVLQASASFGLAQASYLRMHGEQGWAALEPAYAYDQERRLFGKLGGRRFEKKYKVLDEVALELDAFADCVRRKREPEPNGVQGMRDVAVMQAIYRSAREGRTVPISYPS